MSGTGQGAGWMSTLARWPFAVLVVLCLALWLPGVLRLPPLDRDESLFAQSSKQMLETGNFVDIRFGPAPRYKKPIGIYWLQAAATEALGAGKRGEIWTYRVPSLLGGLLAAWLLTWLARAIAPPEVALVGGALLAATVLLTAESTIATTDAVLLSTIIAAQGVMLRAYMAARGGPKLGLGIAMAAWLAAGLGILMKGPVVLAVCAVTAAALSLWDRDWKWLKNLRPWRGVAVMLAIALPWLIAIALRSHGAFYAQSLGHDFGGKLVSGEEAHGAWPGYFLALVSFSFWPATLFLIPAIGAAWAHRSEPAARFLLTWAVATWAMVELVPTKLPHYILPAYPGLALLAAFWAIRSEPPVTRGQRAMIYAAAVQFAIGLVALAVAPIFAMNKFMNGAEPWLIAWIAVGALIGVASLVSLLRQKNTMALAFSVLAALALYPALTAATAPQLSTIWVSSRAAAAVEKDKRAGDPPPVLAGYTEPSMVFLLGTQTRLTGGATAAEVEAGEGGLALIEDSEGKSFLARLATLGGQVVKVDEISGLNYSRGRRVHITFYRVAPVAQLTAPPLE